VHPVTILLSLPLTVPFALLSLWLSGEHAQPVLGPGHARAVRRGEEELDPSDRPHEPPARAGMPRYDAIIQGNRDRLRPILMTTLRLVAGMLPLWLGTGRAPKSGAPSRSS
jgi:HAE1 family hydrophobic/amphiphilic exporter-1